MSNELQRGKLALDVANQSIVEVINPDTGTVEEQKDAMQDLIAGAEGNQAVGFDSETRCVEVRYIGVEEDEDSRSYTMPETRIVISDALIDALTALARDAGIAEKVHPQLAEQGVATRLDEYTDG